MATLAAPDGRHRALAGDQPGQPDGVVGAGFAAGHQQHFVIRQRCNANFAAEGIEGAVAVGHPLITIVHQIVELLTPQRRLRRFRARHRAQRRRRRYAERRLFPLPTQAVSLPTRFCRSSIKTEPLSTPAGRWSAGHWPARALYPPEPAGETHRSSRCRRF